MADIIKRPTVGPTKSTNAAGDRLDAAVPNPDDWCLPTPPPAHNFYLTTKPYPVYARDNITEEHEITFIGLAGWDEGIITNSFEFINGYSTQVISYSDYSFGPDNMTNSFEFVDGAVTQIIDYAAYAFGPDNMTNSFSFEDGTLTVVIGYVFIDQPPDNIVEDHIITGITLTL